MTGINKPTQTSEQEAQVIIDSARSGKPIGRVTPEGLIVARGKINSLPEGERQKVQVQLDTLSQQVSRESSLEVVSLFEGTQSNLMQKAPEIANEIMEDAIKKWKGPPLAPEQKENIKLAIVNRIASGAFAQAMMGGVQMRLQSITDKFSKIDIKKISNISQLDEIAKDFSLDGGTKSESGAKKTMEEKITEQVVQMMMDGLGEIQQAHESHPQPEGYTLLLAHPKALTSYRFGQDIPSLLRASGDAIGTKEAFKAEIKSKILKLDGQIISMQGTKEKVLDTIAHIPEMASNWLFEMMEWVFKIPIFGKFAAAFLGFDDPKTAIDELKMETRQRKAVQLLVSFGVTRKANGQVIPGENQGSLRILKDVDFTGVNLEKLKPFLKKMKELGVDVSKYDFWNSVFVDGTLDVGEGDKKKTITFPKWEEGKETTETIIKKLNGNQQAPTPTLAVPQETLKSTPIGTTTAGAPAGVVGVVAAGAGLGRTPEKASSNRNEAIAQALQNAQQIPFTFDFGGKKEEVGFTVDGGLTIGNDRFVLEGQGKLAFVPISAKILQITITPEGKIALTHKYSDTEKNGKPRGPILIDKKEMISELGSLLALATGGLKEIPSKDDPDSKLIITRIA